MASTEPPPIRSFRGAETDRRERATPWRIFFSFLEGRAPRSGALPAMKACGADWLSRGMTSLNKPTRYEVRDGKY